MRDNEYEYDFDCTLKIQNPKYIWKCELFGAGKNGLTLYTTAENTPNMFWRIVQYYLIGNKWERIKNEEQS